MSDKIEEIRERHELVGGSGSVIHPTGFSWTIPGWVAHADRATLLAEVDRLRAEIERLRAGNEKLREALSWYADQRNHFPVEHRRPGDPDPAVVFVEEPPIMSDGGKRARKALWGKP